MNLIDRFEALIERLVERTFTRATNSQLHPVEIGKRLVRAMESHQSVGVDGVLVPNVYEVFLSTSDFAHFKPAELSIGKSLSNDLARAARQRQFRMLGRPVILMHEDADLPSGDIRVDPHLQDVETPAPQVASQHTSVLPQAVVAEVAATAPGPPASPTIRFDGRPFAVLHSPTKVGRLATNDIVLDDKRVSRHHADVLEQSGRWMVRDAGSTNGTAVNGKIVKEAVLKPGDKISLGGLEVIWEQ